MELNELISRYQILDQNFQSNKEEDPTYVETGFLGLDHILGDGIPLGSMISIEGDLVNQSGKSGVGYLLAAALQRMGLIFWVDTNDDFSAPHADQNGVLLDPSDLCLCKLRQAEDVIRVIERVILAQASGIIIDSLGGLYSKYNEVSINSKVLVPSLLSRVLPRLKGRGSKRGVTTVLITQYNENQSQLIGGPALKCLPDIRLRVHSTKRLKHRGITVGIRSVVTCIKNKWAAPFKEWVMDIRFDSGVDRKMDLIRYGVQIGVIEQSGSWLKYNDKNFQGVNELYENLGGNVEQESLYNLCQLRDRQNRPRSN